MPLSADSMRLNVQYLSVGENKQNSNTHASTVSSCVSGEEMYSIASKLQEQFKVSGWFENGSGGVGVQSSFSNDAKNLLRTQNVTPHCSPVTMGSIPSIKSNEMRMGVKGFADDDGAKSMAALMKLQNATASEQDWVDSSAAARTGSQMIALQNSKISATLSGLDDYVQKCLAGNIGVPIAYYLKHITHSQLCKMWMAKYYPGRFLSIGGDDSGTSGGEFRWWFRRLGKLSGKPVTLL
jgi:hypothetical protein